VLGQAAGVASVLSLRESCPPREVDVPALQEELRSQHCIINQDDIEATEPDEVPYEG
jgi:hypothetical protein